MDRYKFQVNMHFGDHIISAVLMHHKFDKATMTHNNIPMVTFGPNLPTILRKLKAKYALKLEEITLEFQPE